MSGLEEFLDRFTKTSPFASRRVGDPEGGTADVASLHERALRAIQEAAEQTRGERRSLGMVIWGEPGIGKTHLLARLSRWAAQNSPNREDVENACCLYLSGLPVCPEMLSRSLLRQVITRLVDGRSERFKDTPLYRMVNRMVKESVYRATKPEGPPSSDHARDIYLKLVSKRMATGEGDASDPRRICEVLFRFFKSAYRRSQGGKDEEVAQLAVRWLAGDDLDESELRDLFDAKPKTLVGLESLPDENAVRTVLAALAEHARCRGQPMILCLDHVDGLTDEQMRALAQFLQPLLDASRNLLVVTVGVMSKLLSFSERRVISRAAWERIARQEVRLSPADPEQARQILEARLQEFFAPFASLPEVKRHVESDPLFPLGRGWFERRLAGLEDVRPRDLLQWAHAQWQAELRKAVALGATAWLQQWPGDAADDAPAVDTGKAAKPSNGAKPLEEQIDEEVAGRLQEQVARRTRDPAMLPPDAAHLCGLVGSLLRQVLAGQPGVAVEHAAHGQSLRDAEYPAYHLTMRRREEMDFEDTVGVTFLATASSASATAVLRRLAGDPWPPSRVFLVTDQRRPLLVGSRGQQYFTMLAGRGPERFRHVTLAPDAYAELDSLHAVIFEARAGDLELGLPDGEVRPVTEEDVIASHRRKDRYRRSPLLGTMLSELRTPSVTVPTAAVAAESAIRHAVAKGGSSTTAKPLSKAPPGVPAKSDIVKRADAAAQKPETEPKKPDAAAKPAAAPHKEPVQPEAAAGPAQPVAKTPPAKPEPEPKPVKAPAPAPTDDLTLDFLDTGDSLGIDLEPSLDPQPSEPAKPVASAAQPSAPAAEPAPKPAPVKPAGKAAASSNGMLDDEGMRKFIGEQLAMSIGMTIHELADKYLEVHSHAVELETCRDRIHEVALQMQDKGLVNATPHDEQGLFLLLR